MSDSFSAFKLHSHTPNSTLNSPAAPKITTVSSLTQPYCICTHCTHLLTSNNNLANVAVQGTSSGFHVQSQQSSRWSPTPAQLLYLEELYRQGTKTPTAEQIQQIASQLRRFGKVEGKNVFYWFQNHKARERQKRRREMETAEKKELYVIGSSEKQEVAEGLRGTGSEVKRQRSGHLVQTAVDLQRSVHYFWLCSCMVSASLEAAEREANGWTQFGEREIQVLKSNREERQTKCQNREMPCFPFSRLKNITTIATTSEAAAPQTLNPPSYNNLPFVPADWESLSYDEEIADTQTLELFPHKRDEQDSIFLTEGKSKYCASASMDSEITSNQFFEFLPRRN